MACAIAGISLSTLEKWLKAGRDADPDTQTPEITFLRLFKRAEAIAEARVVGNVLKASEKEAFWAAGMTYLERKHPEAWGKRSEDGNSPKVIVQIGVQATEVSVTFASPASLSPSSPQVLSLDSHSLTEARESDNQHSVNQPPEPALALPAASRGHGLTEAAVVGGGLPADGCAVLKAVRRRGRKEKKA